MGALVIIRALLAPGRRSPESFVVARQHHAQQPHAQPAKVSRTSIWRRWEHERPRGPEATATVGSTHVVNGLPTLLMGVAAMAVRRRKRSSQRTCLAQGPPRDVEIVALERAAAHARREAAEMEADLLQSRQDEQLKWFKLFDVNNNGVVTVSELQQGMMKFRESQLSEDMAKRLLEQHDANHDGVLQFEEFDIFRLSSTLEVLTTEAAEHEVERQAEEQARLEGQLRKQLELASLPPANEDTGLLIRLSSVLPYALPLLDALKFGAPLMSFFPGTKDVFAPLYVAYWVRDIIPFGPLLLFIGLQSMAENFSLPRLLRFNLLQAVELDVVTALLDLFKIAVFFLVFGSGPDQVAEQIGLPDNGMIEIAVLANIVIGILIFFALVACIAYSVTATVFGLAPDGIPFISAWADGRLKPTRPKDCEVQGPPLDPKSADLRAPSEPKVADAS